MYVTCLTERHFYTSLDSGLWNPGKLRNLESLKLFSRRIFRSREKRSTVVIRRYVHTTTHCLSERRYFQTSDASSRDSRKISESWNLEIIKPRRLRVAGESNALVILETSTPLSVSNSYEEFGLLEFWKFRLTRLSCARSQASEPLYNRSFFAVVESAEFRGFGTLKLFILRTSIPKAFDDGPHRVPH